MTTARGDQPHDHDRGPSFDPAAMTGRAWLARRRTGAPLGHRRLMGRRRALQLVAGAGLAALAGCGSDGGGESSASASSSTSGDSGGATTSTDAAGSGDAGSDAECSTIPEETAGPYPGDGSNGPDVLGEGGVVRSDIRSSFGSAGGVAEGVPATVNLTILDTASGCAPLSGAAVYVWHCDREGRYSLYSQGAEGENYLRGVQEADASGVVSFTSIFPACYPGRWPHIHFEVYGSVADATGGGSPLVTSQVAIPEDVCDQAYAADGYEQSVANLAQLSLDTDMVFADGYAQELASVTGGVDDGFVIELSVPV